MASNLCKCLQRSTHLLCISSTSSTHSKASNNLWKQSNQQNQFNHPSNRSHQDQRTKPSNSFQPSSAKGVVCPNNGSCHYLNKCSLFQDLSPLDRREHVKKLKLCFNCFGSHHIQQCTSKNVCRSADCGKKHHTILHEGFIANNQDKETACSYLPHHPVSIENKPGKIRRVTNASSVFQGHSLNSNLSKGHHLLSNLVGVVLRFRKQQVAISTDTEQMYMQIKVAPSDCAFLRFLWNHNGKIEEYKYTRHIFGATSSPCIASYALRRSARDNQDKFPQVLHVIERNVYMDDLNISTANVESAVNVMNSTKECLSLGCFNITKWNDEFLKNVANENLLKPDLPSHQPQKVLGSPWNASTDEYIIDKRLFKGSPMINSQHRGNF